MNKEFHNLSENYLKILDLMTGLTTEEILDLSLQQMISSRSILECGCSHSDLQAEWLYNQCKKYIEIFKKIHK